MSSIDMPARANTFSVAGIGAVSIILGSAPASEKFTKRARGVRPSSRRLLLTHDQQRRSTISDLRRVAGGDPAAFFLRAEDRLQLGQRLSRRLAQTLIDRHQLPVGSDDRQDLGLEATLRRGTRRVLLRTRPESIELIS